MLLSDYKFKFKTTIMELAEQLNSRSSKRHISKSSLARWRDEGARVVTKGGRIIRIEKVRVLWEEDSNDS